MILKLFGDLMLEFKFSGRPVAFPIPAPIRESWRVCEVAAEPLVAESLVGIAAELLGGIAAELIVGFGAAEFAASLRIGDPTWSCAACDVPVGGSSVRRDRFLRRSDCDCKLVMAIFCESVWILFDVVVEDDDVVALTSCLHKMPWASHLKRISRSWFSSAGENFVTGALQT